MIRVRSRCNATFACVAILPLVKFRSFGPSLETVAFQASLVHGLELGARSTATTSSFRIPIRRQRSTNFVQVLRMAGPFCRRNSATVL